MAELRNYDILGAAQQGYAFGNQIKQQRQNEQRRNALADLAGQAYGAAPDQRQGLIQQAIATDPEAGLALDQGLSSADDRRNRTMVNMARLLTTAPETQRDGLYQRMIPTLRQFGMQNLPPQYDETVGQTAQSIIRAYSGAGGGVGVQSTYVDGDGNRVAIMRDGSIQILGKNDAGATQQTISITGPDGRPAQYTFDRRTGNYVPAGASMGAGQAAAPQVTRFTAPDGMQVAIGDDIDPAMRDAIMQYERGLGAIPDGTRAQLPDRPVAQFSAGGQVAQAPQAGSPFVGQSPAEKAASETAARRAAENSMPALPSGYRYNASGDMEAIPGGPADPSVMAARPLPPAQRMRLEQNQRKEQQMVRTMEASMDQSIRLVDELLAERNSFSGVTGMGALGSRIPGTPWADIAAKLDTLKARSAFGSLQEMRANSPTGGALGAVSERELYLLQNAETQLQNSQSPQALEKGLRDYKNTLMAAKNRLRDGVNQFYDDSGINDGSATQASGGTTQRARNPQTGEILELRDGQWVPAR